MLVIYLSNVNMYTVYIIIYHIFCINSSSITQIWTFLLLSSNWFFASRFSPSISTLQWTSAFSLSIHHCVTSSVSNISRQPLHTHSVHTHTHTEYIHTVNHTHSNKNAILIRTRAWITFLELLLIFRIESSLQPPSDTKIRHPLPPRSLLPSPFGTIVLNETCLTKDNT